MTLKQALDFGRAILIAKEIPDPALDAWYLLEFCTQISRASYFANPEREMEFVQWDLYQELIMKRSQRIPLQHITGVQEFMGYIFKVNEEVLIPRQDTETLVEKSLEQIEDGMKILDMCTGSGCIIISTVLMAGLKGMNITGTGVDISRKALDVAIENDVANHSDCHFLESDLFTNVTGKYHMIISNPPYIPTADIRVLEEEVKLHDPMLALDGMEDGLAFYRQIVKESVKYLEPKGQLLFEIGYDQGQALEELMEEAGFKNISIIKDLSGLDRVVMGHL